MGGAIGQILAFAVGVAISPIPIAAVILMLLSRRATANGISFLVGWVLGLFVVGVVVIALDLETSAGTPSDTSGWIRIVIGAAFLVAGLRRWRERPRSGEEPKTPAWMATVDEFNAAKSFGLAVLLSAVNPKNLGLTIAAGAVIGSSGLERGEEAIVLIVYVAIASLTVAAPVFVYLFLGARADQPLREMKDWLTANNAVVLAVLFVVIGAKVLGDGISIVS